MTLRLGVMPRTLPPFFVVTCLLGLAVPGARATLLVYDNFDSYNFGSISGQTATGLGVTGTYAISASGFNVTTLGAGLTFSTLSTNSSAGRGITASSTNNGVNMSVQLASSVGTVNG